MGTEIRWKTGERIFENSHWVPGAFIFVYAAVLFGMWVAHITQPLWKPFSAIRLRPPPPAPVCPTPANER